MARLNIFNTQPGATDSAGAGAGHVLTTSTTNPSRSAAFRLFGADGELERISLELIRPDVSAGTLELSFFLEFFGDRPALNAPPTLRQSLLLNQNTPWARECTQVVGAAGVVTHSAVERRLDLVGSATNPGTAYLLNGIGVHGLWARVAFWCRSAVPSGAELLVFAYLGGHDEAAYLETNEANPYVYNA